MSSYQSPVKGNQFAARDTMAEVAVFGEFLADGKGPGREPFDVPNGTQIAEEELLERIVPDEQISSIVECMSMCIPLSQCDAKIWWNFQEGKEIADVLDFVANILAGQSSQDQLGFQSASRKQTFPAQLMNPLSLRSPCPLSLPPGFAEQVRAQEQARFARVEARITPRSSRQDTFAPVRRRASNSTCSSSKRTVFRRDGSVRTGADLPMQTPPRGPRIAQVKRTIATNPDNVSSCYTSARNTESDSTIDNDDTERRDSGNTGKRALRSPGRLQQDLACAPQDCSYQHCDLCGATLNDGSERCRCKLQKRPWGLMFVLGAATAIAHVAARLILHSIRDRDASRKVVPAATADSCKG